MALSPTAFHLPSPAFWFYRYTETVTIILDSCDHNHGQHNSLFKMTSTLHQDLLKVWFVGSGLASFLPKIYFGHYFQFGHKLWEKQYSANLTGVKIPFHSYACHLKHFYLWPLKNNNNKKSPAGRTTWCSICKYINHPAVCLALCFPPASLHSQRKSKSGACRSHPPGQPSIIRRTWSSLDCWDIASYQHRKDVVILHHKFPSCFTSPSQAAGHEDYWVQQCSSLYLLPGNNTLWTTAWAYLHGCQPKVGSWCHWIETRFTPL